MSQGPKPREPVELRLSLKERSSGAPPKLKLAHEKLMHLILVRKDLDSFQHLHPELVSEGKLTQRATFPTPGEYLLFADFTPEAGEQQVERATVSVAGPAPAETSLTPNADRQSVDRSLNVQLVTEPAQLVSRSPIMLSFRLTDAKSGKPAANLKPYLGAMGHAVIISSNGREYVHAHPVEAASSAASGEREGTPGRHPGGLGHLDSGGHTPATADPGAVTFHTEFPSPGVYKMWGQFNVGGTVHTVPFVVDVAEGPRATNPTVAAPEGSSALSSGARVIGQRRSSFLHSGTGSVGFLAPKTVS